MNYYMYVTIIMMFQEIINDFTTIINKLIENVIHNSVTTTFD